MTIATIQEAFTITENHLRDKFARSPALFTSVDTAPPTRHVYEAIHYKEYSINRYWLLLNISVEIRPNGSAWKTTVAITGKYTAGLWFAPPVENYTKDLATRYQGAVDLFAHVIGDELDALLV